MGGANTCKQRKVCVPDVKRTLRPDGEYVVSDAVEHHVFVTNGWAKVRVSNQVAIETRSQRSEILGWILGIRKVIPE